MPADRHSADIPGYPDAVSYTHLDVYKRQEKEIEKTEELFR